MKFYFEGSFNASPRKKGKLAKVGITPDTNSRACREIFVIVAKEISEVISGDNYNFGFVGKKKTPMIFPATKQDNRILVMGNIPQPRHRQEGYLDREKSTGHLIDESQGGGAWGSGSCFLAILNEGERMVSNKLIVWSNVGGELKKEKFQSLAEYELRYDEDTHIEML